MGVQLEINGRSHTIEADSDTPLLWVVRDLVGLTGTKFGCGMSLCGACTVWLDDAPVRSCQTPLSAVGGKKITTIEALAVTRAGAAAQKAWLDAQVVQCGYCQSGQLMSAAALLTRNPKPTDADIDDAMGGNVCRCGTYPRIRAAIHAAAASLAEGREHGR
jgi:isoquinoline 1-oxidoreductase alpha subunit